MASEIDRIDRIIGGFRGGAVGDALGEPVEFLSAQERKERWGDRGVEGYVHDGWGHFTDDTQMTLFTAEALIVQAQTGEPLPIALHKAYLRWLLTQEIRPQHLHPDQFDQEGFLLDHQELYQRMGPGRTCLTALARAWHLGMPAINDSKGCGGLMRVAPIGFWAALQGAQWPLERTFQVASIAAQLTHGHPCGYLSAGAFAAILQEVCNDTPLNEATAFVCDYMEKLGETSKPTRSALEHAVALAESGASWTEAVDRLGAGWVAEEILATAVFLGWVADDFDSAIRLAANHPGDADSVGAIAGQLLGTVLGAGTIGSRWTDRIVAYSIVENTALLLAGARQQLASLS